jgi:hypothetical protein
MTINPNSDLVRNFLLAVISVSGMVKVAIDAYTKRSQRRREEKKAQRELEVAAALAERDRKKAEFDEAVAKKVEEVARLANESSQKNETALTEVKGELRQTHEQVDKVHTIVNSEKTAGMEELKSSRLLTLTAFKLLLLKEPGNPELRQAVSVAQTLYDKISKDTADKVTADKRS